MQTVLTNEKTGAYRSNKLFRADGLFGFRHSSDRRFWMAWESVQDHDEDIVAGVMDDFGTLVETETF